MLLIKKISKVIFIVPRFLQKFVMNQGEDTTPTKYYAISAFTYLVAMVTSNKALTWVNYPTQVNNTSYMSAFYLRIKFSSSRHASFLPFSAPASARMAPSFKNTDRDYQSLLTEIMQTLSKVTPSTVILKRL